MTLIQCMKGAAETVVGGDTYEFALDEHGRYVANVENLVHQACFLSVRHYRIAEAIASAPAEPSTEEPVPPAPAADTPPEPQPPSSATVPQLAAPVASALPKRSRGKRKAS